jgi:hypothetical protein
MKILNLNRLAAAAINYFCGHLVTVNSLVALFYLGTRLAGLAADAPYRVLTTAAEVRSLSAAEAEKHYPVKLHGVVTFYDDGLFSRFLQDDTAGIYLEVTNKLALQAGQLIEVEGATGSGEFAPVVVPTSVKVVGEGKIPYAKLSSLERLLSGAEDSQMVEINGNVRAACFENLAGNYFVEIVAGGERFTVITKQLPVANPENLLDATVRVRGVCSTLFNHQRQLFGFQLLVPNVDGLIIEQAAPANPYDVPTQPIDGLLQFTPQGNLGHRVKVSGTVVYFQPGNAVFIQDGKHGLHCQTLLRDPLQLGDIVEVLGSPAKGEYTPILEDAIYRKIGAGTEPKADVVDLNRILTGAHDFLDLNDILSGAHDCRLVQVSAKVLERVDRGINQFLLLEAGDFIFPAYLPQGAIGDQLPGLVNGSEVIVTGICLIERGNTWQAGKDWRAKSFRLLVRSPKDIVLVQAPSEWSYQMLLGIVGAIEVVILVVIFGVWRKKFLA